MAKSTLKNNLGIVVLAAGKATRMESKMNKVLHLVAGKPMLGRVLETLHKLNPDRIAVVIGHQGDQVKKAFSSDKDISWARQKEMRGTGDAVRSAERVFRGFKGAVLVTPGDVPGIKVETLRRFVMWHQASDDVITILTAELEDPTGYGRIVPDRDGRVSRIVEEKDSTRREKEIQEINTGLMLFDARFLFASLKLLKPLNRQKEYYLTDLVEIARQAGKTVGRFRVQDITETLGVNNREELAEMNRLFCEEKISQLMKGGVGFGDPEIAVVEPEVDMDRDVFVEGHSVVSGKSKVAEGSVIGFDSQIHNSELGKNVTTGKHVVVKDSKVGEGTEIGSNTVIGESGE